MDRIDQYKKKGFAFGSAEARVARAYQVENRRKVERSKNIARNRFADIPDDDISNDVVLPGVPQSSSANGPVDSRLKQLLRWKAAKEMKKKNESEKKKPPFVVGIPRVKPWSSNKTVSVSPCRHTHGKKKTVTVLTPRITRATAKRLAEKQKLNETTDKIVGSLLKIVKGKTENNAVTKRKLNNQQQGNFSLLRSSTNRKFQAPQGIVPVRILNRNEIPAKQDIQKHISQIIENSSIFNNANNIKRTLIDTSFDKFTRNSTGKNTTNKENATDQNIKYPERLTDENMILLTDKNTSRNELTNTNTTERNNNKTNETTQEFTKEKIFNKSISTTMNESASAKYDTALLLSPIPASFSPFITTKRGKHNAREEHRTRLGLNSSLNNSVPTKDTISGMLNISVEDQQKTAQYYKYLLDQETERLLNLCNEWEKIQNDSDTMKNQQFIINGAITQTKLLLNKKFERFRNLALDCEKGDTETLVSSRDLQSFWEMMATEIRDCHTRFEKLNNLQLNGWIEEQSEEQDKTEVEKSVTKKKKVTNRSDMRASIENSERQQQNEQQNAGPKDDEMIVIEPRVEHTKETPHYYKYLLNQETERLLTLCNEWEKIQEDPDIIEDGQYIINQAIGQTKLLLKNKFERFRNLISDCEKGNSKMFVSCQDLEGFWDLMSMEITDCHMRFEKLNKLTMNGWIEEQSEVKKKTKVKKRAAEKKKVTGKSNMRVFIKTSRKQQQNEENIESGNDPILIEESCTEQAEKTPLYYRYLLNHESERLLSLCNEWETIQQDPDTTEDGQYIINQAIGQTKLLLKKKFERFRNLISDCETGDSVMFVSCQDLEGFYDMMSMEIKDCHTRFEKLNKLKINGWIEEQPEVKQKTKVKKPAAKKKKVIGRSNMRAFIEASRKHQQNKENTDNEAENDEELVAESSADQTNEETVKKSSQKKRKISSVKLHQSTPYINSEQTPSRGILKKTDEIHSEVNKLTAKVNFNDTIIINDISSDKPIKVRRSKRLSFIRKSLRFDQHNSITDEKQENNLSIHELSRHEADGSIIEELQKSEEKIKCSFSDVHGSAKSTSRSKKPSKKKQSKSVNVNENNIITPSTSKVLRKRTHPNNLALEKAGKNTEDDENVNNMNIMTPTLSKRNAQLFNDESLCLNHSITSSSNRRSSRKSIKLNNSGDCMACTSFKATPVSQKKNRKVSLM